MSDDSLCVDQIIADMEKARQASKNVLQIWAEDDAALKAAGNVLEVQNAERVKSATDLNALQLSAKIGRDYGVIDDQKRQA